MWLCLRAGCISSAAAARAEGGGPLSQPRRKPVENENEIISTHVCTTQQSPIYLLEPSLREGRALQVLDRPDLVRQLLPLLPLDRGLPGVGQQLQRLLVLPQVDLGA